MRTSLFIAGPATIPAASKQTSLTCGYPKTEFLSRLSAGTRCFVMYPIPPESQCATKSSSRGLWANLDDTIVDNAPAESKADQVRLADRPVFDSISEDKAHRRSRPIPESHFLVVDKPIGLSSAKIVLDIKTQLNTLLKHELKQRMLNFKKQHPLARRAGKRLKYMKVGHGGTLDPFASGVLVIGLEKATKLLTSVLSGSKVYQAEALLGSCMDTLDCTGQVLDTRPYNHITREGMQDMITSKYLGNILQTPPQFSAIKRDGLPMYKYAREGQHITLEPRPVQVFRFEILEFRLPYVRFEMDVSGGCYIRSLVDDLAKDLGSFAHLTQLRRTNCSGFGLEGAISGHDIILLGDQLLDHLIPSSHVSGLEVGDREDGSDDEDHDADVDDDDDDEDDPKTEQQLTSRLPH